MPKSLVIVESPTKARTIARFLGDEFVVESSIGHIRDLPESAKEIPEEVKKQPWARLGIDVDHDFRPLYIVHEEKKKQVAKLKSLLKDADALYLATDEDREGESISWHLMEVLQPSVPTHRLVFHEITREAIDNALANPRAIDARLVTAQETRRILDRLYGYEISPLLWRKIGPSLSAGRVQSVAVRLIVERERARMAFRQGAYWDVEGSFLPAGAGESGRFKAILVSLDNRRLAGGKDFDDATGKLAVSKTDLMLLEADGAASLAERLKGVTFKVEKAERKPYKSSPPAPFTTSTLQQEGNRKLGFSSRDTMRIAQSLYEQGHITYMRTDSTTLSEQALKAARSQIKALYGDEYLPETPRVFHTKVKNAQEAHEAIRPAGDSFKKPDELRGQLDDREARLYEMIWKRTLASQMKEARGQRLSLVVSGGGAQFQAGGRTIEFPGFLRNYVEGSDDPEAELGDQERLLPDLSPGQELSARELLPREHVTQPPARFTEASLIKILEKEGIGRPSTYASIINTISQRGYVTRKGNAMVPSFTAFAVVRLLEEYFTHLVDVGFTARLEDALDAISRGERESLPYLQDFYTGTSDLPGLKDLLTSEIDPRRACTIPLPGQEQTDEAVINVRIGRYGPFLEREDQRAALPNGITPDELSLEKADDLLRKGSQPDILGDDPATGMKIYLKTGRFGPYVQLGETGEQPKMKSLLPGQLPEQITLDEALQLLSLPRMLGRDPDSGEVVNADLGRYGPYLKMGKESRSLSQPEALFTVTLEEALEILRQPKVRRGAATVIRSLGEHPEGGAEISLRSGRYGPYVTDGETNASLPRGENPDELTLEQAVKLIAERAAKGPAKKGGRKTAARKQPAKKAAGKTAGKTAGKAAGKTAGKTKTTRKKTAGKTSSGGGKAAKTTKTAQASRKK